MSSVSKDGSGWRVQWLDEGKRQGIRLGKMTQKQAERVRSAVDDLLRSREHGTTWSEETVAWLNRIGPDLYQRLASAGLVAPRVKVNATLGDFYTFMVSLKPGLGKKSLLAHIGTRKRMLAFFGDVELKTVTEARIAEWIRWSKAEGYADATINRDVKRAREVFKEALAYNLCQKNPVTSIRQFALRDANSSRNFYVTPEAFAQLLDFAPNASVRLLLTLGRYAGLRLPSEIVELRWVDIDWVNRRLRVREAKTRERYAPISEAVCSALQECYDPEQTHVIPREYTYGPGIWNLVQKMFRKLGKKSWPRTLHNLRASCETDWSKRFPMHVVCQWIGHSVTTAQKHYLMVSESDYAAGAAFVSPVQVPHQKEVSDVRG